MGTWGTGSFDNDSAADFIKEVAEDGVVALREALEVVLDPDLDYVEVEEGSRAMAAAEIIAALTSGDYRNITDGALLVWVEETDAKTVAGQREQALDAVDRVLGPDSELPERWEDSDDLREWQRDVQRLRSSLG